MGGSKIMIKRVVFKERKGLRWFFVDTKTKREYFISLYPADIVFLKYGVSILLPPTKISHISGMWN